jgi:acetyl-CoA synthetase
VDTWWQTETGSIMISPCPASRPPNPTRPRSRSPASLLKSWADGKPWPSMLPTIYGDPERYVQNYWSRYPGKYFTGDGCKLDDDGLFLAARARG